ncbi:MAG TPA: hypothetical protein PLZ61_02205 [Candidatus Cryosericum sp.]|nr:hypothetical protein [Candidatus Cryosericum sp.]
MVDSEKGLSSSFVVSMLGGTETLIMPGGDKSYFIKARRADLEEEDRISNAGLRLQARDAKRIGGEAVLDTLINPGASFMEKCLCQVKNFRVRVVREKVIDGVSQTVEEDLEYDPKNGGDNRSNRELYTFLCDRRLQVPVEMLTGGERAYLGDDETATTVPLMRIVDGFLDWVSGRTTAAAEDFEALGKGLLA